MDQPRLEEVDCRENGQWAYKNTNDGTRWKGLVEIRHGWERGSNTNIERTADGFLLPIAHAVRAVGQKINFSRCTHAENDRAALS